MILRKVTLSNWRAIEKFEMRLDDGLNVLQGGNEAGKSSVVEAVEWALFRDISGARLRAEEVRVLVPARAPSARPSVEIELEFSDCRVHLLKILSEDAGKRECRLTLRRDGLADEFFDRTEAQTRLRALFAADGLGAERGGAAGGALLLAHQGEGADFLFDGQAAIRSTLGVGNDGQLALTARLERARGAVETLRRRELTQELEPLAIAAARAGTEAARARESLREARRARAHFEAVQREIEDLRAQIEELQARRAQIGPQEDAATARVSELGAQLVAQNDADKAILSAQNAEREAQSALELLKNRAAEIARLRQGQESAARELAGSEAAVAEAQRALQEARNECDAAAQRSAETQHESDQSREVCDAWRHYLDVFEARRARDDERRALDSLRELGDALRDRQLARDEAPQAPTFEEIRAWRGAFERWRSLENEAAQGLQLEVLARQNLELFWRADAAAPQKLALENGARLALGALGEGVLKIAGVGALRVRSGARGVEELRGEIEAAREELHQQLRAWRVEAKELPQAFEVWEERRARFEAAEREWKNAVESLRREEARLGSLHDAKARVAERVAEYERAKVACQAFDGVLEVGKKKRPEVKAAFEEADARARELSTRANRARNDAATAAQKLRVAEAHFHDLKARPDALRATIAGRAEELERLENDGLSATQRAAQLDDANQKLARARLDWEGAKSQRRDMGDGVSPWKLEDARRAALVLSEARDEVEKTLIAKHRDLFHACEQDAGAEIERLGAEIEAGELETARHEARLRGIALLDAAIEAERARLSRDLAGPLNAKLGPWLSQLRGKETRLGFDEAGSRIETVLTREGDALLALPFAEHSEGLKEQVAFALRLLLASRVAAHLPSRRLPVVLDDPFTQSDAARRAGLGQVLSDAAQTLQILFVTCHEAPAAPGLALNLIRLGDWQESEAPAKPASQAPHRAERVVLESSIGDGTIGDGTLALF